MKLRYQFNAYNFDMPTFERKGRFLIPEFEKGRIVVREHPKENKRISVLGIMPRPVDEEAENNKIFRYGFLSALNRDLLGYTQLSKYIKSATFLIRVQENEQSKGYGTVLMNAAAKNCRDSGIQRLQGKFDRSDDKIEERIAFYQEKLGIPVHLYDDPQLKTTIDNPLLNTISFAKDKDATEILNSMYILQNER